MHVIIDLQARLQTGSRSRRSVVSFSVSAAVGLVRSCLGHILLYFHISAVSFNSVLQTPLDSSGYFEQEQLVLLDEPGPLILKTKRRDPGTNAHHSPTQPDVHALGLWEQTCHCADHISTSLSKRNGTWHTGCNLTASILLYFTVVVLNIKSPESGRMLGISLEYKILFNTCSLRPPSYFYVSSAWVQSYSTAWWCGWNVHSSWLAAVFSLALSKRSQANCFQMTACRGDITHGGAARPTGVC